MARIDDLPADQQAVLRLLLTQDRSYEEIARSLRMAPAAVRDRAHEALSTLGPDDTSLSSSRRAQLTDYLLGQQDDETHDATRSYLAGAPAAKAWARVVAGELRPMGTSSLPEIDGTPASAAAPDREPETAQATAVRAPAPVVAPAPEREREQAAASDDPFSDEASTPRSARERSTKPRSSRRGGAILLAVAGVLATLAIGFFIGRATKSDDSSGASGAKATTSTTADTVLGQANLTPPKGAPAPKALGVAQFVERDGQRLINVIAEGLPRAPKNSGFGIWMTGPGQKPVWLGYFQAVSSTGQVGAQSRLPVDPAKYQTVLLSLQTGRKPTVPAQTYLSGSVKLKSS